MKYVEPNRELELRAWLYNKKVYILQATYLHKHGQISIIISLKKSDKVIQPRAEKEPSCNDQQDVLPLVYERTPSCKRLYNIKVDQYSVGTYAEIFSNNA